MTPKELEPQKYQHKFGNLIHTRVKEKVYVTELKNGFYGFINNLGIPHNKDVKFKIKSLSYAKSNQ